MPLIVIINFTTVPQIKLGATYLIFDLSLCGLGQDDAVVRAAIVTTITAISPVVGNASVVTTAIAVAIIGAFVATVKTIGPPTETLVFQALRTEPMNGSISSSEGIDH